MSDALLQCTVVYHANMISKAKCLINQGGTSSSKTYSIMQALIQRAITERGMVITVTGESIPNLKKGAYRDTETIYSNSPLMRRWVSTWNKTDRIIQFKSGSIIEFVSNLDEQSAKNGKRDYLFCNEANGISWLIFFQLAIRTRKQVYVDYNPSAPFWAHEKLIGTGPGTNDLSATVQLIISDHRHNTFLTADEHAKIEGIKDKELWRVYARGLTGNLTGLIYTNWKVIPVEAFPEYGRRFYSIDFGYDNDPTALYRNARIGDNGYTHELAYQSGDIPPKTIREILIADGYHEEMPLYCERDPDQITQLYMLGINAQGAKKGPGSILAGIQKLKEYNMHYTSTSTNLAEELKRYMWLVDSDTGKPTNTPKPGFDHGCDAVRYGFYTDFFNSE
jgi:phage terminase large subunit